VGLYRDSGVVLRSHLLGEADKIVTLLTYDNGLLRAVAKGVRRTRSKFGARLEPMSHVDLQLHTGRSLDIVTQAESLHPFAQYVGADYARYTAGTAVLETALRLLPVEREPSPALYGLLVGGLHALTVTGREPGLVLDAFALRALAVAGYGPGFDACTRCGAPGPHSAVALDAGGVVCPLCRPPGTAHVPPEAVTLLGDLLSGDWGAAEASEDWARRRASGVVTALLQWHLESGVRSLRLVERP
jgi:DNA repair protein RecO (recombination protein O)